MDPKMKNKGNVKIGFVNQRIGDRRMFHGSN